MSAPAPEARATARPSGLIDTIQAGFNAVNRNAWLLLLPLLIDIALWLGPRVTVGPLAERWLQQLVPPPGANDELARAVEQGRESSLQMIQQHGGIGHYNLIALLSVPIIGVPSYQAGSPGEGPLLPIGSVPAAIAMVIGATAAGLCVAAVFYGLLGQAVREGRAEPRRFVREFLSILMWTISLFVLVILVVISAGLPIGLVVILARTIMPPLESILWPILIGLLIWAFVYLFFTTDAVFVGRVPPIIAAQQSVRVVRHNFWPTLGFIGLILIISAGLPILWNTIAQTLHEPGTALAMVGHIYVSSGLAAASMTYYKERFERLTQ